MRDSTCFPTFRALAENKAILYTIIDVKVFFFVLFCFLSFSFFFQIYNIIAKQFFPCAGHLTRLSNPLLYGRAVETTWTLP